MVYLLGGHKCVQCNKGENKVVEEFMIEIKVSNHKDLQV